MGNMNINCNSINFLLLLSTILAYCPLQEDFFPRFNCYESFSFPRLFLRLFIHTFSGPEYIFVTFMSEIKYNETNKTYIHPPAQFHFKKINGSCESSNIILTTHVLNYTVFTIHVGIYFPSSGTKISKMHYIFQKGFKSYEYLLVDEYENFGILSFVIHSKDLFLQTVVVKQKEADAYLRLIKNINNHICIVTENSHEVILEPVWNQFSKADGYIISVLVNLDYPQKYYSQTYNEAYEESFIYHAYQCTKPEGYNQQLIFITEKNPQVYFYAIHIKFDQNDTIIEEKTNFKINNFVEKAFYSSLIIPKGANIVILMKSYIYRVKFSNDTMIRRYSLKIRPSFYAKKRVTIEIQPNVKTRRWVKYRGFKIFKDRKL